jgi:phosphoribosylanthranilate isomerase
LKATRNRPKLKICGITNVADMRLVNRSGADYAGILAGVEYSERNLSLEQARMVAAESALPVVVLLCDPEPAYVVEVVKRVEPTAIQLLCLEPPAMVSNLKKMVGCEIWKSVHMPVQVGQFAPEMYVKAGADVILIDSVDTSEGFVRFGGTGATVDWWRAADLVDNLEVPVFLSGGINPANIEQALREVKPYGVDLCSGVEAEKGKKDPVKLTNLVERFRASVVPPGEHV